jgi:tRNA G10  N-methylase Trm11
VTRGDLARLFDVADTAPHPARFTPAVAAVMVRQLAGARLVLDPFAGTGGIHHIADTIGARSVGVELQPKWAAWHPRTIVGNARALPFADAGVDAIGTSPSFGNRMADHHHARDDSYRRTYRHLYGEPLHPDNAGAMPWGPKYRAIHEQAWAEAVRVLQPHGRLVLNMKDHKRAGRVVPVTAWHIQTLCALGLTRTDHVRLATPGYRRGANRDRVDHESVITFTKDRP